MLPYKTIVEINEASNVPKYLQITNEFIKNITCGIIVPGQKLPGSRQLAEMLKLNRRTVIAAYDELAAQGWVSITPNKGCFVKSKFPTIKPRVISNEKTIKKETEKVSFYLKKSHPIGIELLRYSLKINDGYPDIRLAPLKELGKNYAYVLRSSMGKNLMNYGQKYLGDEVLRQELVKYLAETRSIHVGTENVMTTRGSLMAFYILFKAILTEKDKDVIVGYPGFNEGHEAIKLAGGQLNFVKVDEEGMNIDQVERLCKKKSIRAVFIIPHHHYPTTVSLSASRRMALLSLAVKYGFAIIEDDYDYDFHYASAPILPIASTDYHGSVAYVGSFSKTIAPSLRLGFIVAPKALINHVSFVSRHIDSFGNIALERAVAMLFKEGLIRRHLRKALKTYKGRRDHFCNLLHQELGEFLDFKTPEGGLAIWTNLKQHALKNLVQAGNEHNICLPDGSGYFLTPFEQNKSRIGFASMNHSEAESVINELKQVFNRL